MQGIVPEWGLGGSFGCGHIDATRIQRSTSWQRRKLRKPSVFSKIALARPLDEYEDLGRVTDALLHTLRLQPGQFTRT